MDIFRQIIEQSESFRWVIFLVAIAFLILIGILSYLFRVLFSPLLALLYVLHYLIEGLLSIPIKLFGWSALNYVCSIQSLGWIAVAILALFLINEWLSSQNLSKSLVKRFFAQQISIEEYEKQAIDYTEIELNKLHSFILDDKAYLSRCSSKKQVEEFLETGYDVSDKAYTKYIRKYGE